MRGLPLLSVGVALFTLLSVSGLAGQRYEPMHVVDTYIGCGADCDLSDGCWGMDEDIAVTAKGSLLPGESWSYSPTDPDCQSWRYLKVVAWKERGYRPGLLVSIDVWGPLGSGHAEALGGLCVRAPYTGQGYTYWRATVRNAERKQVNGAALYIGDWFILAEDCPVIPVGG